MNEIQVTFFSLNDLIDKRLWHSFLLDVEQCIGEKLSHFDVNDPVRKKVTSIENAVEYICAFKDQESSRRLFGKFGRSKVEISISLFVGESDFPNNVSFYFPSKLLGSDEGIQAILNIFKLGNEYLKPFYSYGDELGQIASKKKSTGMAVDLEAELIGMFWLTYINQKYVDFFGIDKVEQFSEFGIDLSINGTGAAFKFGKLPALPDSIELRSAAEKTLGAESFVDPGLGFDKPRGQQALNYNQLRC